MKNITTSILLLVTFTTVPIIQSVQANDFCIRYFCRVDAGYLGDWSKNLPDDGASHMEHFDEGFLYGRTHGFQPAIFGESLSAFFEGEYAWRSEDSAINGANEGFITSGLFYVQEDIYNPDDLPKLSGGVEISLSDSETHDQNSNLSLIAASRTIFDNKSKDIILEGGYRFSDWQGETSGDTIFADFQFRYDNPFSQEGEAEGLKKLHDYFVARVVVENFNPNNTSPYNTTASIQPFVWRKRLLPFTQSNFDFDLYMDVILGGEWTWYEGDVIPDGRSYFSMLGFSFVFNNFDPNPKVGGGGGSGGRYYRP